MPTEADPITPAPRKAAWKRWVKVAIKVAVVLLLVWFVRRTVVTGLADLRKNPRPLDWGWLGLAGGFYLLAVLPAGLFWRQVLRAMGQNAGLLEALRAYYIGHLGKYVPGKALVVLLRAGLVRSQRVDAGVAAVSVFYETGTMMAVGAAIAAVLVGTQFGLAHHVSWAAVAAAVVLLIPTLPPVFTRLVRLTGVGRLHQAAVAHLAGLRYGTLAAGWLWMSAGWLIMGLSLWAVLRAIGADSVSLGQHFGALVAAVTVSVVAGFFSFIPGGAIVREAILVQWMAPTFGDTLAVLSAVLLRLVWLVAEVLISIILYWMQRRVPA